MTQIDTPSDELKQLGRIYHGIGVIVCAVIAALVTAFVLLPLSNQTQAVSVNQQAEQRYLDQHQDLEEQIRAVSGRLKLQQSKLTELTEQIPASADEATFLGQLHELADQCELELGRFTPGAPVSHASYSSVDIRIDATAGYPAICRFLDGLAGLRRLCELDRMVIEPRGKEFADYTVTFVLRIYFASPDQISTVNENHA